MARSKSITLVKKSSRKTAPKQCLGCLMVAENSIWERSFTDWSMLSHAAKSLPIDVAGFAVLKQFIAHKPEPKAVLVPVEPILKTAGPPTAHQSTHNAKLTYPR